MHIIKNKNWILPALVFFAAAIISCFYIEGIPYPFCVYRTNAIDTIPELPAEDALVQHFTNNGWHVRLNNFRERPKLLPHKENILEAQSKQIRFLAEPHMTVYIARMDPDFTNEYQGQVQIIIDDGNRIVNRAIYMDIIKDFNTEFGTDVNPTNFNYASFCGNGATLD